MWRAGTVATVPERLPAINAGFQNNSHSASVCRCGDESRSTSWWHSAFLAGGGGTEEGSGGLTVLDRSEYARFSGR